MDEIGVKVFHQELGGLREDGIIDTQHLDSLLQEVLGPLLTDVRAIPPGMIGVPHEDDVPLANRKPTQDVFADLGLWRQPLKII